MFVSVPTSAALPVSDEATTQPVDGGSVNYRTHTLVSLSSAIVLSVFVAGPDAQRRAPGQTPAKQGIEVSLKMGGQTYQSRVPGQCTHAPVASIYQVMSELWSVQQSAEGRSLSLSFWRPKDGSNDMVTLSVTSGNTSHEVNTVRGGGATSGSGKVTLAKAGEGGTFTLDAKTQNGTAISGTIKCSAFAPHLAEGGLEDR